MTVKIVGALVVMGCLLLGGCREYGELQKTAWYQEQKQWVRSAPPDRVREVLDGVRELWAGRVESVSGEEALMSVVLRPAEQLAGRRQKGRGDTVVLRVERNTLTPVPGPGETWAFSCLRHIKSQRYVVAGTLAPVRNDRP